MLTRLFRGRHTSSDSRRGRATESAGRERFAPEPLEPRALLAAVAWDGEAQDGDWHNPTNWDADVVPGVDDDVTIGAGPTVEVFIDTSQDVVVRSLDVQENFVVRGGLTVTDSTTFGGAANILFSNTSVETNNLTLEAGTGTVVFNGQWWRSWRIGGESVLRRDLVNNFGEVIVEESGVLRFEEGVGGVEGRIVAPTGGVRLALGATMVGTGSGLMNLEFGSRLTLDPGATLEGVGIRTNQLSPTAYARLNMPTGGVGVFEGCTLDLRRASILGEMAIINSSSSIIDASAAFNPVRVEGGEILLGGRLRFDLGLSVTGATVTLGDTSTPASTTFWSPNTPIEIVGSTIDVTELTYFEGSVIESTIAGDATLRVDELAGSVIQEGAVVFVTERLSRSPDELLTGWRAADVRGTLLIGGQDVEWTSGSIHLLGQASRMRVGASAALSVDFGVAWVTGQGRVTNLGTMTALNGGVLRIDTRIDTPGTIAARGGQVTLKGDIVQVTGAGVLAGGTWWAGMGGTVWFDEASIVRNSATVVVQGAGSLSRLRTMTRNNGHITLTNAGGWVASNAQANLINKGTIIKDGSGTRTIVGTITQMPRGTIEVRTGTLTLDTPAFTNAGEIILSNASHNLPAGRLRITGIFEQTDGGLLSYTGRVAEESGFPRLIAEEFRLDGSLTVTFSGHVGGSIRPVLGSSGSTRVGTFAASGVNIQQGVGLLQYTPRGWQVLITG